MESEALTADEFNSVVSAVTNAFGDPTRREIYLFARDAGAAGVTAGAVAEQFDLHPNVARHHLEKLTGGGYLVVEIARAAVDGPARAAGRPSKRYLAGPLDATLALPLKHDDLLNGLLARALDSRSRSSTTTSSTASSRAHSTRSAPPRRKRWPTRSASSTARRSPPAWIPPKGTGRCAPRSPRSPTH
jgi:DNA-binding transcriptional ArsR family regulator